MPKTPDDSRCPVAHCSCASHVSSRAHFIDNGSLIDYCVVLDAMLWQIDLLKMHFAMLTTNLHWAMLVSMLLLVALLTPVVAAKKHALHFTLCQRQQHISPELTHLLLRLLSERTSMSTMSSQWP